MENRNSISAIREHTLFLKREERELKYREIFKIESANNKTREELLEECLELGLPVSENDDIEILKLIYEAAKDRARNKRD